MSLTLSVQLRYEGIMSNKNANLSVQKLYSRANIIFKHNYVYERNFQFSGCVLLKKSNTVKLFFVIISAIKMWVAPWHKFVIMNLTHKTSDSIKKPDANMSKHYAWFSLKYFWNWLRPKLYWPLLSSYWCLSQHL